MNTTASSFFESRSVPVSAGLFPIPRSRTETSRKHIILFRALTCGQLVVQAELAVAVVAAERAVFLRALGVFVGGFELGVYGALGEAEDVVDARFGFFGIERDDCAIGETGTLAEGRWCYLC